MDKNEIKINSLNELENFTDEEKQSITKIELADNIFALPDKAFAKYQSLSSINLNNVHVLGKLVFNNLNLKTVNLSEIETIYKESFFQCNIDELIIDKTLDDIYIDNKANEGIIEQIIGWNKVNILRVYINNQKSLQNLINYTNIDPNLKILASNNSQLSVYWQDIIKTYNYFLETYELLKEACQEEKDKKFMPDVYSNAYYCLEKTNHLLDDDILKDTVFVKYYYKMCHDLLKLAENLKEENLVDSQISEDQAIIRSYINKERRNNE